MAKLDLWHRRVKKRNAVSSQLRYRLRENQVEQNQEGEFKTEVESQLWLFQQEFKRYFPDLGNTELPELKVTRNSFRLNENILSGDLQQEFLDMKYNNVYWFCNGGASPKRTCHKNKKKTAFVDISRVSVEWLCQEGLLKILQTRLRLSGKEHLFKRSNQRYNECSYSESETALKQDL